MSNQQLLLILLVLRLMQRPRPPPPTPFARTAPFPVRPTALPPVKPAVPLPVQPAAPPPSPPRPRGSMLPAMRAAQTLSSQGRDTGQTLVLGRSHPSLGGGPVPAYLVCEAEGRFVGRVRVNPSGQEAIHIEDLSVREAFRGRGAGARLLEAALQLGQRWGRGKAWLEADDKGSGRLLAWYQRLGFQLAGKGPHGRPVLEARAAHALPVIRRQRGTRAAGQPTYTLRAVPARHAARSHP